jgi:Ser/Thr protein kinase RdoA (MazF antagonist)
MMASVGHSPQLLRSLGAFMSRLDVVLSSYNHPSARRVHFWDISQLHLLDPFVPSITDEHNRSLVLKA